MKISYNCYGNWTLNIFWHICLILSVIFEEETCWHRIPDERNKWKETGGGQDRTWGSGMENPPGRGQWSIRKTNTKKGFRTCWKEEERISPSSQKLMFVVFAHKDGAPMQTFCALHEILLNGDGNALFAGQDRVWVTPSWDWAWAQAAEGSALRSVYVLYFPGGHWGNQWNQRRFWPSWEPSSPAHSSSSCSCWICLQKVPTTLSSHHRTLQHWVLRKHSLISLPTSPEGRQLTGLYFKSCNVERLSVSLGREKVLGDSALALCFMAKQIFLCCRVHSLWSSPEFPWALPLQPAAPQ